MIQAIKRRQPIGDVLDSSLHPVLDRIYRSRQINSVEQLEKTAKALLHYRDLLGIEKASTIVCDAIRSQKKICIVGDFDADGATSTALCVLALRAMGATFVDYLVPNRFDFGYGLSAQIVDVAHQQGAQIIITVDSGIACCDGVAVAKSLGMDVVITDHHLPGPSLPEADAIVNPNQPGCRFASKHIAGVGVAFYLMSAVRAKLLESKWFENKHITPPSLAIWLDIVAIGTVADVVTLDKNNRIFVHQGLQRIKAGKCRPGISAMLSIANRPARYLTASDLGFVIGPRLNAAGRLDDMALGIECLLAEDVYTAREMAAKLDALNAQRKQIEQEMSSDAQKIVERLISQTDCESLPDGLVVYDENFHQGVIGILAGRLKEKFNRPTIAFAKDGDELLKGSARSISGIHIRDCLEAIDKTNPGLILKFGGHAMAAGLSIEKNKLEAFHVEFCRALNTVCASANFDKTLLTDGELEAQDFNLAFTQMLLQSGPFGQGFEAPCFDNEFTLASQRIVGEKHLKLGLITPDGQPIDAIAFNVDTALWPNQTAKKVRAVYSPDVNVFRDKTSLQLIVQHIEPC